jgi:alpha-L-fucosidase
LLQLIVGAACGNGNLLLSWGPHWNGQFDESQKERLFEIGDWLGVNGESIYNTRGGPWKPGNWGGSTRRGHKAYIHLFNKPGAEWSLPALGGIKVVSAKLQASGESLRFNQDDRRILIILPDTVTIRDFLPGIVPALCWTKRLQLPDKSGYMDRLVWEPVKFLIPIFP